MPWWVMLIMVFVFMGGMRRMMSQGWEPEGHRGKRRRLQGEANLEQTVERALAERDTVIEDLQNRISELESRLDFTERLLAARTEPEAAVSTLRP